jgi:hypothetical protein
MNFISKHFENETENVMQSVYLINFILFDDAENDLNLSPPKHK